MKKGDKAPELTMPVFGTLNFKKKPYSAVATVTNENGFVVKYMYKFKRIDKKETERLNRGKRQGIDNMCRVDGLQMIHNVVD